MPYGRSMSGTDRPAPPGYELIRVLGAGGFGEVVLARHVRLGRLVAIKRIHEYALTDDEAVDRFQREAKVLASTHCPSVVRVYDLCRSAGVAQLVMEYVPGQPLADLLEAGPMASADGLVVLRDVAEALAVAAARGIAHRDVKPGNVFVMPSGHAKLGDFGLARIASDPAVFRTTGGAAMGTPAYFPPELSQGLSEPDERSDAYSFAVMAYEVLTGRLPFDGENAMALISAHWTRTPRHPGSIVPGFPDAAAAALLAGLDKAPERRPLALELVEQLSAVPAASWPPVIRRPSADGGTRRGDPTVRAHIRPGESPAPTLVPPPRGRSRRKVAAWGGLSAAAVLAAAAATYGLVSPTAHPLRIEEVSVSSDPSSGGGTCPQAEITFTATIQTNGAPGSIDLRWTQPDGLSTDVRHIEVATDQRRVVAQLLFTVSGMQPLTGDAVVHVLRPNEVSGRRTMHYECPAP